MSGRNRSKYLDTSDVLPSASLFNFDFKDKSRNKKKDESTLSSSVALTPPGKRRGRSKRSHESASGNEDEDDVFHAEKSVKSSSKDSKKRKIESPKTIANTKGNLSTRNQKDSSSTKKGGNKNVSSSLSPSLSTRKKPLAQKSKTVSSSDDDDDEEEEITTRSKKSTSPPNRLTSSSSKKVQNKSSNQKSPSRSSNINGQENKKNLEKKRESTAHIVKSTVNHKNKSKSNFISSSEEEEETDESDDDGEKEGGGSSNKRSNKNTDTMAKNIQNSNSPRKRPIKTSSTSEKPNLSKIPKNSEEVQKTSNKDDEKRKPSTNTKRVDPSTPERKKANAENIQTKEKPVTKKTKNNHEREEESEFSDSGSISQTDSSKRQKPESPRRSIASINNSPLSVNNRNAIEDDVVPMVPIINPDSAFLDALPDRDMTEYSNLINAGGSVSNLIRVPIRSPSVTFALTGDHTWTEVQPGILMTVTFESPKVKTGFIRISSRTIKPFEKTAIGQITLAVMEGTVRVKSTSFDFNEKREPYLVSAELTPGGHICIPNRSMYSLENWDNDDDVSLHYCIIHNNRD